MRTAVRLKGQAELYSEILTQTLKEERRGKKQKRGRGEEGRKEEAEEGERERERECTPMYEREEERGEREGQGGERKLRWLTLSAL